VDVRVASVDVAADQAGLGGVVGVVGAVQAEVAQGLELRLDAVEPGGVVRRVGQLDGVLLTEAPRFDADVVAFGARGNSGVGGS
jgi:hypothetical protein